MLESKKSVILIVYDDLTSSTIFTPLVLSGVVQVKFVVFDGRLLAANKGVLSGAWTLLNKLAKKYWVYQSFLMVNYRLASLMPSFLVSSSRLPTLRQACRRNSIPFITCDDVNDIDFIQKIHELAPDRVMIRCSQIIRKSLLDAVGGFVYCIHSSLLPSYKGIAAEFHSMVNEEKRIGSSLFNVVEKLDAGNVLFQQSLSIMAGKSHYWHVMQNNRMASKMVIDFMLNNNSEYPLDRNVVESYFSWPTPADYKTFKQKRLSLIKINEVMSVLFSIFLGGKRNP